MKPYYDDGKGIVIYHADALDVLRAEVLPVVDTIVGDPPYCSGGRQQQTARSVLAKAADREASWFLTDNMGTDSYLWWMREISGHLFSLASVGAHAYIFTDWRQFTNVVTACETKGWALRNCVVWSKARGGAMGSFWRNDHEWLPVFSKGPPRPVTHHSCFNVWTGTKPQGGYHATEKPKELIRYVLEVAGGDVVLDPWMGTGTTLEAAKAQGKRAIGIEIEEKYCETAARRLSQEVLPLGGAA